MKPAKKRAIVGIAVCNNVVASVKRRARLGITTGKRKNPRIPKGEPYSGVLAKDAQVWDLMHAHFHATKGFRGGEL